MLNLYSNKLLSGLIAGCIGAFTNNLFFLLVAVLVFEAVDFITGCWKSAVEARRRGDNFAFESVKAWRTIYKIVFIFVGIFLAEILDTMICEQRLRLADIFASFCCGVEFWSFLENAAYISNHPVFLWLRKFMKHSVEKELDTNFDNLKKDED